MNKAQNILSLAEKYNNSQDLLNDVYQINSNDVFDAIIIAPSWTPEKILKNYVSQIVCLKKQAYISSYNVKFDNLNLAWIQCASGANNLIDSMLILANSKCEKIIFIGAVGALNKETMLGDLVTPSESYAFEGGSIYLNDKLDSSNFGNVVKPYNIEFIDKVIEEACKQSIKLKKKKVYCTDSILCEYSHLDFIKNTKAELIEMETASFYKCLKMMNKNGMALLCVSDNFTTGISLITRSEEENNFFHKSREYGIPELIKIVCKQ